MARRLPAGVYLDARECAVLDSLLMRALRDVQMRDGALPSDVAEIAAPIHQAAGEFRAAVLVSPGSGTGRDHPGSVRRSLTPTERLTVREAAQLTGISESYLRRLARKGVVTATRSGSRGEWQLDGGQLAALIAERSETRKAA